MDTRIARSRAHDAFDRLWRELRLMSRSDAYEWLGRELDLPPRERHIGQMSIEACDLLVQRVFVFLVERGLADPNDRPE